MHHTRMRFMQRFLSDLFCYGRCVNSEAAILAICIDKQLEQTKNAYGGLLRSLMEIYGDSMEAKARLFDELSGNKPSERLIKTGIYLVNHVE